MIWTFAGSGIALLSLLFGANHLRQKRDQKQLEDYSISAEALHKLLGSKQQILLYDVRLPLDLLAKSEIIPGATRIPPKELLENPEIIPRDKDSVVYCTCASDATSRAILNRALEMKFFRVKFLKGGLSAWKEKGYPVEPYTESFHLDTGS